LLENDPIYQECLRQARKSPCQKLGFGAVLVDSRGVMLASECNRTIEGLESLCQPACMRLNIQSRTESMLGACGHAEERLLWSMVREGWKLHDKSLYVSGVQANGLPNEQHRPEFTCLRCAVAINYSGIGSVHVVFADQWHRLTPQECLAAAQTYARSEKKI
jgi:deoxycytidylate deaminase